jgi:hypothetical protein
MLTSMGGTGLKNGLRAAQAEFARRLRELVAKAIAQGAPESAAADEMRALGSELDEGGRK